MHVKTTGVVISSLKYSDSQLICRIFTKDKGMVPFIVRISKSKKSNKNRSSFQPLSILNLEYGYRESANIQSLKDWNTSYMFHSLPYDDIKRTVALFLAETLNKLLKDESKNDELFDFLESSIQYFDLKENDFSNFHVWFLIQLTKHVGLGPTIESGYYFDFDEAEYSNTKPIHPNFLEKDLLSKFTQFLKVGLDNFSLVKLSRNERVELLKKIIDYYLLRYPELVEIKSLSILKDVFA